MKGLLTIFQDNSILISEPSRLEFGEEFQGYLNNFFDMAVQGQNPSIETKLGKVGTNYKVAQKTLRKLEDRIDNAKKTIAVVDNVKIDGNVLIIDDACGSGATLNEIAKKLEKYCVSSELKIVGYAIVGSRKGFDVISEV